MGDSGRGGVTGYQTKVCPRCGARLYADMDICYGCLYDFTRDASGPEGPALPLGRLGKDADETLDLGAGSAGDAGGEVGMLVRTPSVDVWVGVPPQGVSVGRGPGNDVVLHSRAVSRGHLRLVPTPDGMEVRDLGATNPARYQGRDLRGTLVVPYGDTIDVCGCVLTMTGPGAASEKMSLTRAASLV